MAQFAENTNRILSDLDLGLRPVEVRTLQSLTEGALEAVS
jgi:hypothetical protein